MNSKKAAVLVAVMLIALVFSACGGSSTGGSYTDYNNDYTSESDNTDTEIDNSVSDEPEYEPTDDFAQEAARTLGSGVYSFYNASGNGYLSFADRTLFLGDAPVSWNVRADGMNDGFMVCAENTLILDIDNAYVHEGTAVKLWERTGYDAQLWVIAENANSTFSICSSVDNTYCLGFENGNAVLQVRDENNPAQEWTVSEMPKPYLQVVSDGDIIELQMPLDITSVISEERLYQWANELETAYYSFAELTGFVPYSSIVVEAYIAFEGTQYAGQGYLGFVTDYSNVIHVDSSFIYGDLAKMSARENDWNFAVLHEMGHMFDMERPWNFEAEAMTDFKIAYVLEKNGAGAAPSQFDTSTIFYGADIINAYAHEAHDFSQTYDIFGCAHRLLQIKDVIGWEPIIQTFHYMQDNYDAYSSLSKAERFINFISLMTYFSGVEVESYFSEGEWNAILNACN